MSEPGRFFFFCVFVDRGLSGSTRGEVVVVVALNKTRKKGFARDRKRKSLKHAGWFGADECLRIDARGFSYRLRDAREVFGGVGSVNSIMILVRLPFERNEDKIADTESGCVVVRHLSFFLCCLLEFKDS